MLVVGSLVKFQNLTGLFKFVRTLIFLIKR